MKPFKPELLRVDYDDNIQKYVGEFEIINSLNKTQYFVEFAAEGFDEDQELEDVTIQFFNEKLEEVSFPFDSLLFDELELEFSMALYQFIVDEAKETVAKDGELVELFEKKYLAN
jgi:hypothetical protein